MGYALRPMPPQLAPEVVTKLLRAETATIGHVRQIGFARRGLEPVIAGGRIAGTAVTLALPSEDACLLHHALGLLRPGDVLVVDRLGDDRHAAWGGIASAMGLASGAAGVIIDGPAADFTEVRAHGFPVWSRGPAPLTQRRHGTGGALNHPICCGGAVVLPGYAVLADEGGALFLPPEEVEELADWAIAKLAGEPETLRRIAAGERMGDINGSSRIVQENLSRWF
jgi:regulator of RNase E activity RraA